MRQRMQRPLGPRDARIPTRSKHGTSASQIVAMLRAQGGRCALCGADITGLGAAHVDHDHVLAATHDHPVTRGCSLCIRALLCRPDNLILGYAQDDPERLERAASYLREWRRRLGPRVVARGAG